MCGGWASGFRALAIVLGSVVLIGAKARIQLPHYPAPEPQRVLERNYEIGVERTAFVGEAVVSLKDYVVVLQTVPMYETDRAFVIRKKKGSGNSPPVVGDAGDRFQHVGTATFKKDIEGLPRSVEVLRPVDSRWIRLLVDEEGRFAGKFLNGRTVIIWNYLIDPPETRFVPVVHEEIVDQEERPYFEIVYTGRSDAVLTFMYREYSFDDFARPAFTQQLTYPSSTQTVRFKAVQLLVHEATPERIAYTVTADGSQ